MKKYLAYFIVEASSKDKAEELLDEMWNDIDPNLEVYVREISMYGMFKGKGRGEFHSDIGFRGE